MAESRKYKNMGLKVGKVEVLDAFCHSYKHVTWSELLFINSLRPNDHIENNK